MNKPLYTSLIFFLALSAASGLLLSIIRFLIGPQTFMLESFASWFLVTNIVSLVGAGLILKYYHYRQYRFAYYAGTFAVLANVCYAIVFYGVMLSRNNIVYYIPVFLAVLFTGIVYGISLIFSEAGEKYWLKAAGYLTLTVGLVGLITAIWASPPNTFLNAGMVEKLSQWTSLAASLIPIAFILHFSAERRALHAEDGSTAPQPLEKTLTWTKIPAFVFTLAFGVLISYQCFSSMYWAKQNFEKTKALARRFEAGAFVGSKGDTLLYRLLAPLDYDPAKKYPLVVCLPYGGQPGTDKIRQLEGAAAAEILSNDANRKKYPAFIFIPNCPPGAGWGGIPGYPAVDSLVYEAISSLDRQYGIDPKRRYVTGISRGGYGAWHFICMHPEMFAAAIPVCGGGNPALAPNIVNVPVWAFHGKKDLNVPVSGSRAMIDAIRQAGGHPKYTEFPDKGHDIWYQVSITPGLWDWLFAQKRG
jgi:hypothetical protein